MSEQTLDIEELEKQIEEYEAQLKTVNAAQQDEPDLPELVTVKQGLIDVIKSTNELLRLKREEEAKVQYTNIHQLAAARGLFTGMQCEAKWRQDGSWYKATITSISENGFGVTFSEYGNVDIVSPDDVRPRPQMEVVVVDVDQPQRPTAPSQIAVNQKGELVIPPSLKILPTDSEAIRKQKKKRVKALKSQYRSQKMDEERNKRKRSWQDFQQHGRTKRLKTGPSIFQSPDSVQGKVGVTGSGKGMTETKALKYEPKKLSSTLPVGVQVKKKTDRGNDDDDDD